VYPLSHAENVLGYGAAIGFDPFTWTGPKGIMRLLRKGGKGAGKTISKGAGKTRGKGWLTPHKTRVNLGTVDETVDETRRAIVTGTPVAAATAGIAGLGGLKYMSKGTKAAKKTPTNLKKLSTTHLQSKLQAKQMKDWDLFFTRYDKDFNEQAAIRNQLEIRELFNELELRALQGDDWAKKVITAFDGSPSL
jgi:hypothetical protein